MILAHRLDGPAGAPVLVLSNSLGTTVGLWEAQLPELLPRFRVLRYDHPGHGDSPVAPDLTVEDLAERVLELLDSLELERVSFCGLSLGGMVGMALALRSPERLDRLALCSTAAYLGPPEGWYERARIVRARGLEPIADSVLSRWFTEVPRRSPGRHRTIPGDAHRDPAPRLCLLLRGDRELGREAADP